MPIKVFISTNEISASQRGASMVQYLQKTYSGQFAFTAIGGEDLKALGVNTICDISTQSSVGFLEAIPHLYSGVMMFKKLKHFFQQEKFDVVICIDGQGRNMPIGKIAKTLGITTLYYFPPPIFIMMPFDAVLVRKYFDAVFCPFDENVHLYQKERVHATHVGHPFVKVAEAKQATSQKELKQKYRIPHTNKVIALFPGSRKQEISKLTPVYLKTMKKLRQVLSHSSNAKNAIASDKITFVLALSHSAFKKQILKYFKKEKLQKNDILIIEDAPNDVYLISDFLWMSSGTATLEASFYHKPHAICYKISWASYLIMRVIAWYSNLKAIGIVNILAKKHICEEFINLRCTPKQLLEYTQKILFNAKNYASIQKELKIQCDKFKRLHPYRAMGEYLVNLKKPHEKY